jgi:PPOX class probable F420-dependent enzyme
MISRTPTVRDTTMKVRPEIAGSKQVSLTTFRKDGTPVPSPVWHVLDGETMIVVTEASAGKVKRIRNNPRVEVTACDIRGKIAPDARPVSGTARLLDEAETKRARDLLAGRYLVSRLGNQLARIFRVKRNPMVGIAITF